MTVLSLCPRCVVTGEAVEAGPMIGASFGGRDAGRTLTLILAEHTAADITLH